MNNIISAFIGALIAYMILLNGTLSNITGNYLSTVIIHVVGLFAITIILLIKKSKVNFRKKIPLYMYSAGAIGVFTVLFNNLSFSDLGVSLTLALGLLGQSLSALIIDHYGLLGMNPVKFERKKIIGLLLITAGIVIMTVL